MGHVIYCITRAMRHPVAALNGAREFRSSVTRHYDNHGRLESYDAGRELAHIATLRHFDY